MSRTSPRLAIEPPRRPLVVSGQAFPDRLPRVIHRSPHGGLRCTNSAARHLSSSDTLVQRPDSRAAKGVSGCVPPRSRSVHCGLLATKALRLRNLGEEVSGRCGGLLFDPLRIRHPLSNLPCLHHVANLVPSRHRPSRFDSFSLAYFVSRTDLRMSRHTNLPPCLLH